MRSVRLQGAYAFVDLLCTIVIIVLLLAMIGPVIAAARVKSAQERCADNLRQIAQAIRFYSMDNMRIGGTYPRTHFKMDGPVIVGANGSDISSIPNAMNDPFTAEARDAAAPEGVGYNNVPAALFLLVRTQQISTDAFVCPSTAAQGDRFVRGGVQRNMTECANFASDGDKTAPGCGLAGSVRRHLSYGYANPYPGMNAIRRGFRMTASMNPEFAVMADMGPGITGPGDDSYRTHDVDAPASQLRWMNSNNHGKEGQNVLFADGHVGWLTTPYMLFGGRRRNHIYVPDTDALYNMLNSSNEQKRSWDGESAQRPGIARRDPTTAAPLDAMDAVCLPWDDSGDDETKVAPLAASADAQATGIHTSAASQASKVVARAWYTVDDGKTWFADDISKVPPFKKDRGEAVRAHVFKGANGRGFVAYLERMSPQGMEVKAPGSTRWVPVSDVSAAEKIMKIAVPDGVAAMRVDP